MDRRVFAVLRDIAQRERVRVRVRGGCMEPVVRDGEEVLVRPRRLYLPGDVIVFRRMTGDLAAHRVLGWRRAGVVTKGDHCDEHDAPVARDRIVGVVERDDAVTPRQRFVAVAHLARIVWRRLTR
jgi:signal peptidase I